MAGQKARIDKDSNDYLTKNARPEGEAETAYKSNDDLEGDLAGADRNGNNPSLFKGSTTKDRSRRADQKTAGTSGIGDAGTGLEKMEGSNPFSGVIRSRFFSESENPGTASAPASSDAPSLGMMAVNNSDFRPPQADVKAVLEGIALQAAETFEMLDENSRIPDPIVNELTNTAKALAKIYEYVTQTMSGNSPDGNDTAPVSREPASTKAGVNEDVEDLDEKLIGKQDRLDKNKNGKLDAHDFKLLRTKKSLAEATDIVFKNILRGMINADH